MILRSRLPSTAVNPPIGKAHLLVDRHTYFEIEYVVLCHSDVELYAASVGTPRTKLRKHRRTPTIFGDRLPSC